MVNLVQTVSAAEAAGDGNLFSALGIDVRLLVLQVIAFGVLVWLLGKFVYPKLIAAIDKREKAIADSMAAATEAETRAEQSQKDIEKLLQKARLEADDIIARSRKEAAAQVSEAEEKAKTRSEQIIKDAHTQLNADIAKARAVLKRDTATLVALATEKVLHEKVDGKKDSELIDRALHQSSEHVLGQQSEERVR
jgi:F-type H+-transporting ATPase subunit b